MAKDAKDLNHYVSHFRQKKQKTLGKHFVKPKLDLDEIIKAEHKNAEATAVAMADQYYKDIGYDMSVYKSPEEKLGFLRNHIGAEAYQKLMNTLESGDIEEAEKHLKTSHKESHASNTNEVKAAEITKLPHEEQLEIAKEFIKLNPKVFGKDATPESVIPKLPVYIQLQARHLDEKETVKGATGKEYIDKMKEIYEAGKKEKK